MIPIEKRNVVDMAYEQMKELIISGEWKPEMKIPSENELKAILNVSRNTVRSAIQKLKTLGILETKQGQGTFVRKSASSAFVNSLMPFISLSKEDILEILEFRKTIEIESVGLAAIRRNQEDIEFIKAAVDEMVENKDDFIRYSIADYQFHLSIARASKNKIFYSVLKNLKDVFYNHFEDMNKELGGEMSVDNHIRIFEAIRNKDEQLAKILMKDNIELSINALEI